MNPVLHGQIHYRCAIDLEPLDNSRDNWRDLVTQVLSWVERNPKVRVQAQARALLEPWFYEGGSWRDKCPKGVLLETVAAEAEPDPGTPKYWACRLEHPCVQYNECRWHTDVAITRKNQDGFRLILINQRSVRPGYIGKEPEPPTASVPRMIMDILRSNSWRCLAGSICLEDEPLTARVGYLDLLKKDIEDRNRSCPIVYVSRDFRTGSPLLDVGRLARLLAGTGIVYVAEGQDSDKEFEELFPKDYRCWNGMVRVYQPSLDYDLPGDSRRHRFFTSSAIEECGSEETILQIVRACCRRLNLLRTDDIASIDDVRAECRIRDLRRIAEQRKEQDPELMALINSVDQDNESLKVKNSFLEGRCGELEQRVEELEESKHRLQGEYDQYKESTQQVYIEKQNLETRLNTLNMFSQLPDSLEKVLEMISGLHTGRVVVLQEAYESARNANLDPKFLHEAWECIWSIPTCLYDLFFMPDQPKDKEQEFKNMTGYDFSMTEGKMTKMNSKNLRQRRRTYMGREIDIIPHVKCGTKEPKCLRVYLCIDQETKRIVIGHCGDHLDTYSTQFLK